MRILVAIDGSEYALRALRFAIAMLAKMPEPRVVALVSVHDDAALRGASHFVGKTAVDEYLAELAEKDLAAAREIARGSGLPVETIVRTGHVAREIVKAADEGGFDILVLGAKGRSGLSDLLVGSVAQRVTSLAQTPVLLVK